MIQRENETLFSPDLKGVWSNRKSASTVHYMTQIDIVRQINPGFSALGLA